MMEVKIKRIENGKLPEYKTSGSVGADCYARIPEKVIVKAKTVETIPLGFAVEIPEGYEMQIRGRSGNARKNWVQVFNSPGTIDSDYRGEVGAILHNASDEDFIVYPNDRIAQAIIAPIIKADWKELQELSETERGEGGFGSTGKSDEPEKFYEPFTNMSEVEPFIGRNVLIDNSLNGIIKSVFKNESNVIVVQVSYVYNPNKYEIFSLLDAFIHIRIFGHRFGKEIKSEDD
jgi:dUTP pyrophosphatase